MTTFTTNTRIDDTTRDFFETFGQFGLVARRFAGRVGSALSRSTSDAEAELAKAQRREAARRAADSLLR